MKKIAMLALVGVFALGLIGCSSASEEDFQGYWTGEYSESGQSATMELGLYGGGAASLSTSTTVLFIPAGNTAEGTWEVAGGNKCKITIDGDATTATLDGDTLTLDLGSGKKVSLTQ